MIKFLQKLLQEPLIHFLLLGFLLYLYYDNVTLDTLKSDTKKEIHLTSYEIKTLQKEYTKKYHKIMSTKELKLYLENTYRKKVLLEESIALELPKTDAVIAKRLVEKMKFILLGSVEYKEPSEEELHEYYSQNINNYSVVETLSFVHIFFSSSINNMEELYGMLHFNQLSTQGLEKVGDVFEGNHIYENISYDELQKKFGKYFASKLVKLSTATWHKAVHSKYGVHLVYITDKKTLKAYSFDEVEDRVYSDYLQERRGDILKRAYENILQNYTLNIEK